MAAIRRNKKFILMLSIIIVFSFLIFSVYISQDYYSDRIINNNIFNNILYKNVKEDEDAKDHLNILKEKIFMNEMTKPINIKDFTSLRNKEQLHTAFWNYTFGQYKNLKNKKGYKTYKKMLIEESSFLAEKNRTIINDKNKLYFSALHQNLYPWLYGYRYKSLGDLVESSKGKGIVICVGDNQYKYAISTIDSIRNVLKSTLPIEIFYIGEGDLSIEHQNNLKKFENVYISDITTYFDNNIIKIIGWASKPFAILASRFEEVLLMDADAVYLHDPEELFEEENYRRMGTLFFKDRTLVPGPNKELEWIKQWLVDPLPETKSLRFFNEKTKFELESSTVLIHKTKTLLGLLSACKLNEGDLREQVVYRVVYGDKETFWLGFDMAQQHYNLYSVPCAFVGKINEAEEKVCGHIGHVVNDKVYFWNEHFVKDKRVGESELKYVDEFDGYYIDDDNIQWTGDLGCLIYKKARRKPSKLSDEERETFKNTFELIKEKKYIKS